MIHVTGEASRILFPRDEHKVVDNGYAIIAFTAVSDAVDDNGNHAKLPVNKTFGTFVAKGTLYHIKLGMTAKMTGHVHADPKFGAYFAVDLAVPVVPKTENEIETVLSSGIFPGVGVIMAMRIVNKFGVDALDVIENTPERLTDVNGISEKTAKAIAKAWQEYQGVIDLLAVFASKDISTGTLIRAFKKWGGAARSKIQDNPYVITHLHGVGFKIADKFAMSLGITADDPRRIGAGVDYAIEQAESDGHVCLPRGELVNRVVDLFANMSQVPLGAEYIDSLITQRLSDGYLASSRFDGDEGEYVYRMKTYEDERLIAKKIKNMVAIPITPIIGMFDKERILSEIAGVEDKVGFTFADAQREAVIAALSSRVSIITGSPGVGKTTIINAIVSILDKNGFRVRLAAPTGKAAMRMEEATGHPAKTIHRLLGAREGGHFEYNADNTIEADYIIVDEVSMINNWLAARLFAAIDDKSHVLLVGDVDQLPAIGAGNVLRDIIDANVVKTVRLDTIFRQDEGSTIVKNAHRINHGDMNLEYSVIGKPPQDMFFFKIADNEETLRQIKDLVVNKIPTRFGYKPDDIQVLTPMKRGILGTQAINSTLQSALNPREAGKHEHTLKNGITFRVGDRVMQTKNDYDKEVFNGETGIITDYDDVNNEFVVKFVGHTTGTPYSIYEVGVLSHAWGVTIHKSQGSEYPVVIVVMSSSHYIMLARNLLYTAITRGRKMAVLIGQSEAIDIAIRTNKVEKRYTGLKHILRRK